MSQYYLKILGPPSIEKERNDVTPTRRKSIGVLAYLSATGKQMPRNELASMFWPDSDPRKALAALRTILTDINSALGSTVFKLLKECIQIDEELLQCDIHQFREQSAIKNSPDDLEKAVNLWNGGFLNGFELKGTPRFTDWQYLEEQNLEQEYRRLLKRISQIHRDNRNEDSALLFRRKLQELDPYDEENHREIMKLHVQMGDNTSALRQLKICRKYLVDDLGFPLEDETNQLADEIQRGDYVQHWRKGNRDSSDVDRTRDPRLAILPFVCEEKISQNKPGFSYIVSEAMTNICSLQKNIEVISRTSTLSYKQSEKNLSRIAAELKADYIIEGQIEDYGEQLLLEARLIKACRDTVVVSEKQECLPSGLSAAYAARDLSARLLKELRIKINPEEEKKEDPGLPWRLHGHSLLKESEVENQKQAYKFFNRALELNNLDAAAWAGIGLTHLSICNIGILGADVEKYYKEADEAADKALELDPDEPVALYIKGCIAEEREWDFDKAERLYNRAILGEPANPLYLNGHLSILIRKKKLAEALEVAEKIYNLDPVSINSLSAKSWTLLITGQYKKDAELRNEAQLLLQSECWMSFNKALLQLYMKNYNEAAIIMENVQDNIIEEGKETLLFIQAYAYGALGQREKSKDMIGLMIGERKNMIGFSLPLAAVYTVLDESEKAMDYIDQAINNRDPGLILLALYPFYTPLRDIPRFREQMKRVNLQAWL